VQRLQQLQKVTKSFTEKCSKEFGAAFGAASGSFMFGSVTHNKWKWSSLRIKLPSFHETVEPET
jgi:hypothetical protein